MWRYAKYDEFENVRLKHDRAGISENPFTELETPRPVTANDRGVIILVHDEELPAYEVEFFDVDGKTIDVLEVNEDELERW
jgi:hypothetical protein